MKLGTFLAAHAVRAPSRIAVVCEDRRLSYADLEASTNRIARRLHQAGVQPGDRVALYLPNSVEFVQAFLGAIKAGALVVPLNLPLSAPEIRHVLRDGEPKAVVLARETQDTFRRACEGMAGLVRIGVGRGVDCDLAFDALADTGDATPLEDSLRSDDCMVCYTSGTTGAPKGAVLTQSNFVFANGLLNGYHWRLGPEDCHLCTTPLAHRTGLARLMNMVLHGATLVLMPRFDAERARELVKRERVTVFGMVPTVGRMVLPAIEAHPEDFSSLRMMLVTGEAFPLDVKQRLQAALPQVRLYSFFAQTEAAAVTGLDAAEQFTHPHSVGRPWPGVEVRAVDAQGRTVACGEVGEIWIRSGQPGHFSTMRGYFRNPEATAAAFQDGWLATGDLGRFDADGYLYLVDRKKDMVVSGGYNIYSKEVELALQSHPAVGDAAVVGVPDPVYGESVVAYVELQTDAQLEAEALIQHCRDRLASYKKPKHIVFVQALPRNSTGKVLKGVLRERVDADLGGSTRAA